LAGPLSILFVRLFIERKKLQASKTWLQAKLKEPEASSLRPKWERAKSEGKKLAYGLLPTAY
jgi:hypothetical protein